MKKTLAILLSLALVICMIPGTAFAGEQPTEITAESTVAVTLASASTTYTGAAQTPAATVTVGGNALPAGYTAVVNWKPTTGDAATTVTNAGTYTAQVTITKDKTESEPAVEIKTWDLQTTYTVNPYDLDKVMILFDNQVGEKTAVTNAAGSTLDTTFGRTAHYYVDSREVTDEATIDLIQAGITVTVAAKADNKQQVTFEKSGNNYTGDVKDTFFSIVDNIANVVVKIDGTTLTGNVIPGFTYNGSVKNLSNMISLYSSADSTAVRLTENVDYRIKCATEVKKAGDYTVTIEGLGKYGSSENFTLTVSPKTADATTVYYDSIPAQAASSINSVTPVIRDRNLGVLTFGTDYTLGAASASGNKGSVRVDFINNYAGTIYVEFPVVTSDKDVANMYPYQGTTSLGSGSTASAFMYNGSSQPLAGITVYTDYANKKELSSYYYTVSYEYTDPTTNKVVATTSPVNATTYNVYIVGQNGYAGKKSIGTYTIPKYNMDYVTITVGMGSAVAKPVVTVKSSFENIYFTEGKDYTMSYYVSSYTNKVLVTVTPTSTGNLTGTSSSEYYPIVAKSISTCSASFTNGKSSSAYTGSAISVPITVKDGYYTTLTEGTHYTVTYKDAAGKTVYSIKDAGTYTIEIAGKGMYDGKIYLYYTVTGTDISYYTVTLKESSVKATGYSQVPTITAVKSGYYSTLKASDYTVTYKNSLGQTVTSMSAPDTYTVVVTGKNGYQGSTTATFRIVGLDQTVTIANGTSKKVYADSDAFQITAKASGDGTGFTWTTSDPTVATVSSTGKVTIVGVGRAKITATTIGTKKYDPASGSFIVKVYPDKVKQTKKPWTDGKKGQLKVRWGYQDGVTKYQIRYSTTSSFKSYTTKTVNAHGDSTLATQSTTLKNLKSGKKYYIKVRAVYQMYNEEGTKITYYGAWSPWKSGTTK